MLLKEENGILRKNEYCKDIIRNFVKHIDTLAGTEPDNIITIEELDKIKVTSENSSSVKALLGINKLPNEQITIDITHNNLFTFPNITNSNDPILERKYRGYGCDWPTKIGYEFTIPDTEDKDLSLFGVNIYCNASDQGFGGTGHTQIRYQINDEASIPGFSIWRDRVLDGNYIINIGPDKVKIGDIVKIWQACPPWSGWKITLKSIKVSVIYA
jgi:hypothetical protein